MFGDYSRDLGYVKEMKFSYGHHFGHNTKYHTLKNELTRVSICIKKSVKVVA